MVGRVKQLVAGRLPESTVRSVVQFRHGELPWQERARAAVRARRGTTVPDGYVLPPLGPVGLLARVVTAFDAHETQQQTVAAVSAALDAAGIEHVLVPQARGPIPRIAVSSGDRAAALSALSAAMRHQPEWAIERDQPGIATARALRVATPLGRVDAETFAGSRVLRIFRVLAAPHGQILTDANLVCHLEFWRRIGSPDVARPDGGNYQVGTRVSPEPVEGIVAYLSPASWKAATASADHWPEAAPRTTLFHVREPVDVVYTWVDGSDPAWLARKAAVDGNVAAAELNDSALHVSRFHSRDELRYSLRSVAAYASWVRRIYLVTDRQVPGWLDTSHPKIELVDHSRIFADPTVLPVFNSHAIESQLHHIPGLSEHYLYLNDDVFFGRPVSPDLFFHGNGASKFFLSKAVLDIDPPSSDDLPVMSAAKRNRRLIEQRFGATVINKFKHTPHPQLKSVLEQMEQEHPDVFEAVSRSRFRHPDDYSLTSSLFHYYAYGLGRAMPSGIRYGYYDIGRPTIRRELGNLLRNRDFDAFCLNDHESDPAHIDEQQAILADFFERYFPVPSPFELAAPRSLG